MAEITTYSKSVVIYLPSAVVQGTLISHHERLSDYLNSRGNNEILSLRDVRVGELGGRISPLSPEGIILYLHQVLFAVDRGADAAHDAPKSQHYVSRELHQVLMGVGRYWLQGTVHILPGGELHHFAQGTTRFIPLTSATLVDDPEIEPRTFLINREKVDWLIAN